MILQPIKDKKDKAKIIGWIIINGKEIYPKNREPVSKLQCMKFLTFSEGRNWMIEGETLYIGRRDDICS